MHSIRKWIRFVFGFSRRETNGFLILLPLMVVAVFSQPVARLLFRPAASDFSREAAILDSLEQLFQTTGATPPQHDSPGSSSAVRQNSNEHRKPVPKWERSKKTTTHITSRFDLNTADTSQLIAVRGIGPTLALRIVRYRDRLGGFVSMDQLYEVFRLDSAAIDALRAVAYIGDGFAPVRLNVNTADEYSLSRHPYVGRSLARLIVTYRFQHGPFGDLEDLYKIHQVNDSVYRRISPYLAVD
jgi:DNA uptake protein ComE-like DNA-binding protein